MDLPEYSKHDRSPPPKYSDEISLPTPPPPVTSDEINSHISFEYIYSRLSHDNQIRFLVERLNALNYN